MSIPSIEGFTPFVPQALTPTAAPGATAAAGTESVSGAAGADFSELLSDGMQRMEGLQDKADKLAVQASTGDLSNLHDYTIAATEASTVTQLTTAVRNKALEAFNEIMRMTV